MALQRKLGITADGIFGPQTLAAVKRYQASRGLAADGIVGPLTAAKLGLSSSGGSTSSRSTSTSSRTSSPPDWTQTPEGRAAMFGWSKAVIDSNPDLKRIFATASKENWTADRFVAAVRDTKWFKTHSDTYRQASILAKADPATYKQRLAQASAQVTALGREMGTAVPSSVAPWIARQVVAFGWTQDQLKQTLLKYVTPNAEGDFRGQAGVAQQQYRQLAAQYGITVANTTMGQWARNTLTGHTSTDTVRNYLIKQAASRYPALAERLRAGETLMDIASPYMQAYAQTLEVNPNAIKLSDTAIQSALSTKDAKGQPATKTLWQFEQDLRRDPRYMKTQQAQDSAMKMTRQVLEDWGIVG